MLFKSDVDTSECSAIVKLTCREREVEGTPTFNINTNIMHYKLASCMLQCMSGHCFTPLLFSAYRPAQTIVYNTLQLLAWVYSHITLWLNEKNASSPAATWAKRRQSGSYLVSYLAVLLCVQISKCRKIQLCRWKWLGTASKWAWKSIFLSGRCPQTPRDVWKAVSLSERKWGAGMKVWVVSSKIAPQL